MHQISYTYFCFDFVKCNLEYISTLDTIRILCERAFLRNRYLVYMSVLKNNLELKFTTLLVIIILTGFIRSLRTTHEMGFRLGVRINNTWFTFIT